MVLAPKVGVQPMPQKIASLIVLSSLAGLTQLGCTEKPLPPDPFEVSVVIESDPGSPLAQAAILRNGKALTMTGADGRAHLTLIGKDGESVDLNVKCPAEYDSPPKPVNVLLRRTSDKKIPEYTASCPPSIRKVVVAVRAENGPFLPVTYLGKPVARTDAAGAAHILLAMKPGDQFELGLDTTAAERLRPQNPRGTFVVKPRDEIQGFDVKFTMEKPKPVYHAPKPRAQKI